MSECQEPSSWLHRGAGCRCPPWLPVGYWERSKPPRANPARGFPRQSCQRGRDHLRPVRLHGDRPSKLPFPKRPASENRALCGLSWRHSPGREGLEGSGFLQKLFHSCPTSARRFLRRAPAVPVGFQTDPETITVTLERLELSHPVDDPGSHRRPVVILVAFFHSVFAMTVADPALRQKIVAIRKRFFAASCSVSRIPVQHEKGRLDRIQNLGGLSSSGGIQAGIILQQQGDAFLTRFVGRLQELLIDRSAIWLLVIQSPEIEAAHAIGLEGLGQLDGMLQHFVLLIESEVGMEVAVLAELRLGSTLPVDFKEWTGDIGHSQSVLLKNTTRVRNLVCVQIENVLVPHAAKLDPLHPEFPRGNFAGTAKVLRDLVVDNGDAERGVQGLSLPGFL